MTSAMQNDILKDIKKLPTLPVVFEKVLSTIDNPRSSASELQETIKNDLSISAKVLNMANSAYYGYSKQVSDITRAVIILGFDMVKNIALSVSVFNLFPSNAESLFDRDKFWLHSIACGYIGKILADETKYDEPDKVFISCLLHDIGKVVLSSFFEEDFNKAIVLMKEENITLLEAEDKIFETNHCDIGFQLGLKWNFPDELLASIKNHHNPAISEKRHLHLTLLTHLANIITYNEDIGSGGNTSPDTISFKFLDRLKLSEKKFKGVLEETRSMKPKLDAIMAALG